MQKQQGFFLIIVLVASSLLFHVGCADEEAGTPQLVVNFPSDGTSYNVKDTIFIGFEASDDQALELVSAKLTTIGGGLASTVDVVSPGTTTYTGTLSVVLEDKYLESGQYSLRVEANNGTNSKFAFIDVNVSAFPKKRRSIIALTGNSPSNAKLEKVDSLGVVSDLFFLSHDGSHLCVDNRNNQVIAIGDNDGGITSVSIKNSTVNWSASTAVQPPAPAFLEITCNNNDILISAYDHLLLGYDHAGALIMNSQTTSTYRPGELFVQDGQLLVEQIQAGTTNNFMFRFNRNSMAFQSQLAVPINVVAICPFDEENVLIFGNDNGQARVFKYSFFSNSIWEPRLLEPGTVTDAVKGDGNTYFIAQSDGVYAYTFSPNYLNLIVVSVNSSHLEFDVDRGVLLAANGNTLQEYSVNGAPLAAHQFSGNIVEFRVHYTK